MARPARKSKRPMNRVDGLRALDRATSPGGVLARPGFRGQTPQPSTPFPAPGAGRGAPAGGRGVPQRSNPFPAPGAPRAGAAPQPSMPFQHPFIPGAPLHPVVPANAAEAGSAPGTPNLAAMVMRSFQPSNLMSTPLVSSGAGGVPRPNPSFNFGGGQLPAGVRSMQPQMQGGY